ncbi:catalytic protein [Xylaria bambusicola]|uniref:catalytic protein n=1 Tax=Xylaria bambusicola TaxID=326684 RepID=UPI00200792CB|nr:catalytic protein [Xylaria bambusicola]KAI0517536.1 catalytic protein [Xylaria bambusicola]
MASSSKPTLVLVQGSFQLPEVYYKLSDALRNAGYRVVQPSLPSLTDQDKPEFALKSLTDDALAIRSKVQELVAKGETVVMVMHSYGGLVGSEAVTEDLSVEQRKSNGLAGGVLHMFYFAAFILTKGQSVLSTFGESSNNLVKPNGRFALKNVADILYHDLPAAEAQYWESKTIDQSYAVQSTEITNEGFRFVPSTYVVCENDRGPPPKYQEIFGKTAGSKIIKLNSGHSPMLSHTDKLVEMINLVVQSAVEGWS